MSTKLDTIFINQAIECLNALGEAWRNDWSDFDGRTLEGQLGDIVMVLNHENTLEKFLESNGIQKNGYDYEWKANDPTRN